jgi:hypothetical protein
MCEFRAPYGSKIVPGAADIEVEAGAEYRLKGALAPDGRSCLLAAAPQRRPARD